MNRARKRLSILRQLGFSLIELIVVIVVLGIVASMGAIVVRDGMLGYLRGREITSADWQGRLALERITRELRDVAPPAVSPTSPMRPAAARRSRFPISTPRRSATRKASPR